MPVLSPADYPKPKTTTLELLEKPRFSFKQIADLAGVTPNAVADWVIRGLDGRRLPYFFIGARRFVLKEDLELYLSHLAVREVRLRGR